MTRLPTLFVAHGSPMLALDKEKGADYTRWAESLPRPEAILIMSAHWVTRYPVLGTTTKRDLIYDFGGFPEKLYKIVYPAARAPYLAEKVKNLLSEKFRTAQMESRGLDHGVWVPLYHMYPSASIPVLQISLPLDESLLDLGKTLSVLRDEGVLIIGSGVVVHNLGRMNMEPEAKPEQWALDFDQWVETALLKGDDLSNYKESSPQFDLAHPTPEHFLPLLFAAGAAPNAKVTFPITGFEYGNLSRRCVQFE